MDGSAAVDLGTGVMVTLWGVGLVAGFVDAIAGGGGLLTLPALLTAGLPPALALGTNKGQSVFGSGAALWKYARSSLLDRARARLAVVPALLGAAAGAALVGTLSPAVLRPVVLTLLLGVAVFLLVRRPGTLEKPPRAQPAWVAVAVAAVVGSYDGFFGPGTGTFLIMAYVGLWHDRMDAASANAKVVNFASNLASMVTFAAAGTVVWKVALPMGLGQAIGGVLGAQLTIRSGTVLVRRMVIGVCMALVARLGWQTLNAL